MFRARPEETLARSVHAYYEDDGSGRRVVVRRYAGFN